MWNSYGTRRDLEEHIKFVKSDHSKRLYNHIFRAILQSNNGKSSIVLSEKQIVDQWNTVNCTERIPWTFSNMVPDEGAKNSDRKIVYLKFVACKTGYIHEEDWI